MAQRSRFPSSGSNYTGNRPTNRYEIVEPTRPYDIPSSIHPVTMATSAPHVASNPMYANRENPQMSPRGQHQASVGGHTYDQHQLGGVKVGSDLTRETHELRMRIFDLERENNQLQDNLKESHIQLKQVNMTLVEKKEAILKYQEQISDLQAEAGDLRLQAHSAQTMLPSPKSVTPAEQALQHQLHQVRGQLTACERRVTELGQANAQLQVQASQRVHGQTHTVDTLRAEVAQLRDENQRLMSRVAVLNHQVSTYNEDFQSERADRERAQGQIDKLKDETESLRHFIQILAQEHHIRLENYGMGEQAYRIGP